MPLCRRGLVSLFVALLCALAPGYAGAAQLSGPLGSLQAQLSLATNHAPGHVAIAVEDLATGKISGINDDASLPAASTIKIPVMVQVFKEMEAGEIDLNTVVHMEARDRDWGWGDMADAPPGTARTVRQLLWLMITESDNTATNMLIRRVGRRDINKTMVDLGLHKTHLGADIRSETETIRYALRTSAHDMLDLLDGIARDKLVDSWSSREMLTILEGQKHNGLLPAPLPKDVKIAHKTGSLHDTLNDVGIVFQDEEPYIIAVMTTQLPDLDLGRAFIHKISRITYNELSRLASWREQAGIAAFSPFRAPQPQVTAPDMRMWDTGATSLPAVSSPPPNSSSEDDS